VTSVPSAVTSTPIQLLSRKWSPKLDVVADDTAACQDMHTQMCASAVAAAGTVGHGVWSDIEATGTTGRYVHALPQARHMTGAAAVYAWYKCGSKIAAAHEQACGQSVLDAIPGAVVLKSQLKGDERQAGLL
jgi:hypothetical protein